MHPFIITSPDGIRLARERTASDKWAEEVVARVQAEADILGNEALPVFEKDWWEEASKKHWSEIYPEVNQHTNFAVFETVKRMRDAAVTYAVTGDAKYAELVRRVLAHFTGYEFFAIHPDVGLNWSVWCMLALQSYDLVYDTIPESDRTGIDDFFERAADAIRNNDQWWLRDNMGGLYNNHLVWHKFFIGTCGLFYDKPDLFDYAINSDQGIRELIENGSRDDGLWFESSINYHYTAVIPLVWFASELANNGGPLDLWNCEFANGRSLKQLALGPIQVLFPDCTIPTIGDTYAHRADLRKSDIYYHVYNAYQAEEAGWLLKDRTDPPFEALFMQNLPPAQAEPPALYTRLWPEHGYAFLRSEEGESYWNGDGFSAFLSYEIDSVHSNRDKFDLIVFGHGAHLGLDVEAKATAKHAFSSNVQNELNRSTLCHNTIMVDRQSHNGIARRLELVSFINSPAFKLSTIADRDGRVYPGVRMMRTVAVTPDIVVDIFQVASEDVHTYDYLFHTFSDTGTFEVPGDFSEVALGEDAPWNWLRNARAAGMENEWRADAMQGDLKFRVTMAGAPGTEAILCDFPSKDDFSEPPYPMLIARRRTASTVFAAVMQAECGDTPKASIQLVERPHNLLRVIVSAGDIRKEISVERI